MGLYRIAGDDLRLDAPGKERGTRFRYGDMMADHVDLKRKTMTAGRYIVGAYAASPGGDAEGEYFAALREADFIEGLELQFTGVLHGDEEWLLRNLRPDWSYVLTTIGGTMLRLGRDPEFGLASESAVGRQRALDYLGKARQAAARLNAHFGRRNVRAVEIHSAPRGESAAGVSAEALRRSLDELRSWDWDGAELVIEHCDALTTGHPPDKGFLPLEAEIQAVRASAGAVPVGIGVNWGRSAIEARDAGAPARQVALLREEKLLSGVIFSGVTVGDAHFADWADRHAPFAEAPDHGQRLLNAARLAECLAAIGGAPLGFLGLKIAMVPGELSPAARVSELRRCAGMLDAAAGPFG